MNLKRLDFFYNITALFRWYHNEVILHICWDKMNCRMIENDEGYISADLLARFDDVRTFPRLPFEPITKAEYEAMLDDGRSRRTTDNFHAALERHDAGELVEAGPAGCDSDKCLMPEKKPS